MARQPTRHGMTYAGRVRYEIVRDEPNAVATPFTLERFASGALVGEHGAAAVAH